MSPGTAATGPISRGGRQKPPHLSPAGDDDGFLPIPGGVVSHDLGMGGDILRRELRGLVWLGVNPPQGLHFLPKRRAFQREMKRLKQDRFERGKKHRGAEGFSFT